MGDIFEDVSILGVEVDGLSKTSMLGISYQNVGFVLILWILLMVDGCLRGRVIHAAGLVLLQILVTYYVKLCKCFLFLSEKLWLIISDRLVRLRSPLIHTLSALLCI